MAWKAGSSGSSGGSSPSPAGPPEVCLEQEQPRGGIRARLHGLQPLRLQAGGGQCCQHRHQPLRPMAQAKATARMQQPGGGVADSGQGAGLFVPAARSAAAALRAPLPGGKIGRVAGDKVVAVILPQGGWLCPIAHRKGGDGAAALRRHGGSGALCQRDRLGGNINAMDAARQAGGTQAQGNDPAAGAEIQRPSPRRGAAKCASSRASVP